MDWLTLHCSDEQWAEVERMLQAEQRADREAAEREDPTAPDLAEMASPAIIALETARITALKTALGAALTIIEEWTQRAHVVNGRAVVGIGKPGEWKGLLSTLRRAHRGG
jgi:hypothetical protein